MQWVQGDQADESSSSISQPPRRNPKCLPFIVDDCSAALTSAMVPM